MSNKVILLFVFFASVNTAVYFLINKRVNDLTEKINFLESAAIYKENFNSKVITKKLKNKVDSVFSLRCNATSETVTIDKDTQVSTKKITLVKWSGTGTKVAKGVVLTADHVVSTNADTSKRQPISCEIFDEGELVGTYKYNAKKKNYLQINERDIALIRVEFNDKGNKNEGIKPSSAKITRGQPVILISHPLTFINNRMTTFGIIVNDNPKKNINGSRPKYWDNVVLTDMSASPGSSGAPVFTTDGIMIGIHVGGEREKGLNLNYQIIFERDVIEAINAFTK